MLGLVALSAACVNQRAHTQAVYMLVDTSGTYVRQLDKAQRVINYVLSQLNPGDTIAVARVVSRSFSEHDIIAKMTLVRDPLQADAQKREFSARIDQFVHSVKRGTGYTDISGGILQGAEFLNETRAGKKTILIFSDMDQDLGPDTIRNFPFSLKGIRIVALNVIKLNSDNVDPRRYIGRLDWWKHRVLSEGATEFRVVNDMEHLDRIFRD